MLLALQELHRSYLVQLTDDAQRARYLELVEQNDVSLAAADDLTLLFNQAQEPVAEAQSSRHQPLSCSGVIMTGKWNQDTRGDGTREMKRGNQPSTGSAFSVGSMSGEFSRDSRSI
jgi:hypothetical protein